MPCWTRDLCSLRLRREYQAGWSDPPRSCLETWYSSQFCVAAICFWRGYNHRRSSVRDIDIRRELRREVERRHQHETDTRILEELGLCQGLARVDLAVVNGSLHGYEIKSERDTLARLPAQSDIYNRTLDFVTIVTEPAHAPKIETIVPPWWGIWCVLTDALAPRIEVLRDPTANPEPVPFAMVQLLWREEALQALSDRGLAGGLRSKPRAQLWRHLATDLTREELGAVVRDCLKRRGASWKALA